MTQTETPNPQIVSADHISALRTVERAIAELRMGGFVAIIDGAGRAWVALAAEVCSDYRLSLLGEMLGIKPVLAITGRRAEALKLPAKGAEAVILADPERGLDAATVTKIADPFFARPLDTAREIDVTVVGGADPHATALRLTKLARLLPRRGGRSGAGR